MGKNLKGHKGGVHGVVTTKDGRLATGSKDEPTESKIRIWDLETGENEVVCMIDKPDAMEVEKPEKDWGLKLDLGRTGFDAGERDEDDYSIPSYEKMHERIVKDTILVENIKEDDNINC